MALVQDLLDRLKRLQADRAPWEQHWFDVARYALPAAERFDQMFSTAGDSSAAINTVVSEPIATKRTREIYDTTSLWAIDRGAAGTLSLVTPESSTWHDVVSSDPFGSDPNDEEQRWYERLRNYLFKARGNPRSGFWTAHKSALRCVWGMGTAVVFIGDSDKGVSSPFSYSFVPLSENHLGTNFEGVVDTNYRLFSRSARQCVERWGNLCSAKTIKMAGDPKDKDKLVTILHAVYPREESGGYGKTTRESPFASCTVEVQEKHLIGESGYFEFPYRVDHWQRNNPGPYAEGPISITLADIKSLNMLRKQELIATQQWTNPPLAVHGSGMTRINLNPRAVNYDAVSAEGRLLVQPMITAQRPDFSRVVIEAAQKQVQTSTYVDLWQTIIQSPREMTAYEVMVKSQEKGDMLGPVGSSLQTGLSFMVDREIAILARQEAFKPGSPLAAPKSLQGKNIGVRFTSPLDRMRQLAELQGLQQLWGFANSIVTVVPDVVDKLDADESIDFAQEVLGAPRKAMASDDVLAARRQARQAQQQGERMVAMTGAAGEAGKAAAEGAQAIADSPAASEILKRIGAGQGVPAQ